MAMESIKAQNKGRVLFGSMTQTQGVRIIEFTNISLLLLALSMTHEKEYDDIDYLQILLGIFITHNSYVLTQLMDIHQGFVILLNESEKNIPRLLSLRVMLSLAK